MAKLIHTGEIEAIDLKHLHGSQIVMLDQAADDASHEDGGEAIWLVVLKGGVLQFLRSLVTSDFYPLKPKKKRAPAA